MDFVWIMILGLIAALCVCGTLHLMKFRWCLYRDLIFPKYHRRTRSDDAVDEAFQTEAEWNAPPPEGLPPRSIAICGSGEIPRLARLVPDSWRWFLPGSAKAGHPLCEADGQCRLVIGILFESLSREEL